MFTDKSHVDSEITNLPITAPKPNAGDISFQSKVSHLIFWFLILVMQR